jgi:macrolide transport system ATP-binding/permease protein
MKRLRAWLIRLAGLVTGARQDRELADEIEANLQLHIDDNLRSGMLPEQARREAILKFGGVEPAKEACRDRRTVPLVENLLRDGRFAIRQLRKNPGFTCTAVLVLGLGLCASVAIFAFVDATLIKPLPYRDPAGLVGLFETVQFCPRCPLSYPDYLDWKRLNTVFSAADAFEDKWFHATHRRRRGNGRWDSRYRRVLQDFGCGSGVGSRFSRQRRCSGSAAHGPC